MTEHSRIRVLYADDHRLVREGIGLIISQQPDMEVVGSAASGEECVRLFKKLRPDITLVDLQMGKMSGVNAIRAIRGAVPSAKIVVLTMYAGDEDIYQAVTAGASAYLLKNTISDDLLGVIRNVHGSQTPLLNSAVKARLAERAGRPHVTPREAEILNFIAAGLRDKEIAQAAGISESTVYVHVRNILAKLDARDRTAAVQTAVRRGIIHRT
ncbi:MAG: response regulator transcription factor [Vicinamibacterales bacterium]